MNLDASGTPRRVAAAASAGGPQQPLSFSLGRLSAPSVSFNTSPISAPASQRNTPAVARSVPPRLPGSSASQQRKARMVWTPEEDAALLAILNGLTPQELELHTKWKDVAQSMVTDRTGKQCRDRYVNHLRGGIKKGQWTREEENLLVDLYNVFGSRWTSMSKVFKVRTDNDLKNKWYAMMRKKQRVQQEMASGLQLGGKVQSGQPAPSTAPVATPQVKSIVHSHRFSPLPSSKKRSLYGAGPNADRSSGLPESPPRAHIRRPGRRDAALDGAPHEPLSHADPSGCQLVSSTTVTDY